jgi:short-subunit dehydrogenase
MSFWIMRVPIHIMTIRMIYSIIAGYGLFGAFEDLSVDEIKAQFETNFFGVIRVTQHVIPIMRTS